MEDLFGSLHASQVVTLILALVLALGFECVNGFHDTANAVATVIYTHSLPPWLAVVWSGLWNLIGVLVSSGAVAFAIVNLLPVELVTDVESPVGLSMIFSLLLSAIIWNLGTWYRGLPVSSTHSMVGSIMGVGLMNALWNSGQIIGGVNWAEAGKVLLSLLISPVIGFAGTAILFLIVKMLLHKPELYRPADPKVAPPWWIRGVLCLTCTGVSYAHGSNDGQKGLGVLMLILAATVPGMYAVNPKTGPESIAQLTAASQQAVAVIKKHTDGAAMDGKEATKTLIAYLRTDGPYSENVFVALAEKNAAIENKLSQHKTLAELSKNERTSLRTEMYLASETIGKLAKTKKIRPDELSVLTKYKSELDKTTTPPCIKKLSFMIY